MLLQESRRDARSFADGELILLEDRIDRLEPRDDGRRRELVREALASRGLRAVHDSSRHPTSMPRPSRPPAQLVPTVGLYDVLLRWDPSPVAELPVGQCGS